jgi:hypothetical protein
MSICSSEYIYNKDKGKKAEMSEKAETNEEKKEEKKQCRAYG